jgi:hypothetical protein
VIEEVAALAEPAGDDPKARDREATMSDPLTHPRRFQDCTT